jgi:MinD superfamily P-loop ATPase
MVCDEVCPYDAVSFLKEEGRSVPVPHVLEQKCAGCGYCEHYCPVQNRAAIVVTPMDALRKKRGSYEIEARLKGFELQLRPPGQKAVPLETYPGMEQGPAPGFDAE